MKLSKQQLDYAIGRMRSKLRENKSKEYPENVSSMMEDPEAVYQVLSKSKAPLVDKNIFIKTWKNEYRSEILCKFFLFPVSFDKKHEDYKRKITEVNAKYEKLEQELEDKLFLSGNAQEALDLINSL
jgi:hypothetical protein